MANFGIFFLDFVIIIIIIIIIIIVIFFFVLKGLLILRKHPTALPLRTFILSSTSVLAFCGDVGDLIQGPTGQVKHCNCSTSQLS